MSYSIWANGVMVLDAPMEVCQCRSLVVEVQSRLVNGSQNIKAGEPANYYRPVFIL
jgi:hypothetical protein